MRVKKDDTVLVITGKDKGKTGKVRQALPKQDRVLVDGINVVKRHTKPRPNVRQAGIIEREMPIHISKIMLMCSKCNHPARVGYTRLDDGSRARVCRRCGEVLD